MLAADPKLAEIRGASPVSPSNQPGSWKDLIKPVEPFLDRVVLSLQDQVKAFEPEIASFARYALSNQGKHLRPVLVALSGQAVAPLNDRHVEVSVIIEMVHLATLVHDDIMDHAEMRRNRPTVASNWGNEVSVLLGDCLFAQALKLASAFPTTDVCRGVSRATRQVCSGEIIQTLRRGSFDVSLDEYLKVVAMKTGELFEVACGLGAAQSDADDEVRRSLETFGRTFGVAYQIYDDCLDIFSSEEKAGKSLGTDIATGKVTLPVLIARDRASDTDRNRLGTLFTHFEDGNLEEIVGILAKYRTLGESVAFVHRHLNEAVEALKPLQESPSKDSLNNLCAILSTQLETLLADRC